MPRVFLVTLLALATLPAGAATRTVELSVPGMTCAACPITVTQALRRLKGVESTKVMLEQRQVAVTFDDRLTSATALTAATRDAGYPSQVVRPRP